jgi:hypothetical protein
LREQHRHHGRTPRREHGGRDVVRMPLRERMGAGSVEGLARHPLPHRRAVLVPDGRGGLVAHAEAPVGEPPDQVDVFADAHRGIEALAECVDACQQKGARHP